MSLLGQKVPQIKVHGEKTPADSEVEIWRGFLATKPTLSQMAAVAKEKTFKSSFRQLALRKLYSLGTKQSLIFLISVSEADAECLDPAIERFFVMITDQLKKKLEDTA